LIVGQGVLALEKPERFGLDEDVPVARLGAHGAIALVGALCEVDVGFELHRAAMATAVVRLFHPALREVVSR
jgi:hypothetical protein